VLAVSNLEYYLPKRIEDSDGTVRWKLARYGSDEYTVATTFTYTIHLIDEEGYRGKIGFIYEKSSVKMTPRCLREIGTQHAQVNNVMKILASNRKDYAHFRGRKPLFGSWYVYNREDLVPDV
jgi:hypothetical protein